MKTKNRTIIQDERQNAEDLLDNVYNMPGKKMQVILEEMEDIIVKYNLTNLETFAVLYNLELNEITSDGKKNYHQMKKINGEIRNKMFDDWEKGLNFTARIKPEKKVEEDKIIPIMESQISICKKCADEIKHRLTFSILNDNSDLETKIDACGDALITIWMTYPEVHDYIEEILCCVKENTLGKKNK
jgi:hypothetical protein